MSSSESTAQLASAPTNCATTCQQNPASGKSNMLQGVWWGCFTVTENWYAWEIYIFIFLFEFGLHWLHWKAFASRWIERPNSANPANASRRFLLDVEIRGFLWTITRITASTPCLLLALIVSRTGRSGADTPDLHSCAKQTSAMCMRITCYEETHAIGIFIKIKGFKVDY